MESGSGEIPDPGGRSGAGPWRNRPSAAVGASAATTIFGRAMDGSVVRSQYGVQPARVGSGQWEKYALARVPGPVVPGDKSRKEPSGCINVGR